jgi:3-hydroxy-3-methylglutaryl CoA synthase
MEKIDDRIELSLEEYEQLHEGKRNLDDFILEPKNEFVLTGIDRGYRHYEYIG